MSFGFSVGDLIGAANVTYRLIRALHGSQDAGEDYRAAIDELGCLQQAFIRVSCLGSNKNFPQATFESASCIIMGSMDIIQSYLDKTKKYDRRLGSFASSGFANGLRKIGWTLFKAEDMKKLRESLHTRLSALGVLLAAAKLDTDEITTQYLEDSGSQTPPSDTRATDVSSKPSRAEVPRPISPEVDVSIHEYHHSTRSIDSAIDIEDKDLEEIGQESDSMEVESIDQTLANVATSALSFLSREELISIITNKPSREAKIKDAATLLRTLVLLGECQLDETDRPTMLRLLDSICDGDSYEAPKLPIRFKDAVGRKFAFPWHLCKVWKGMEELIKQAFLHVDVIGPHVHEGHYDLVGPDGEIILPQVWETMVKPDWTITMHMWPMPEAPPDPKPPSPPTRSKKKSKRPLVSTPSSPPSPPLPADQSELDLKFLELEGLLSPAELEIDPVKELVWRNKSIDQEIEDGQIGITSDVYERLSNDPARDYV